MLATQNIIEYSLFPLIVVWLRGDLRLDVAVQNHVSIIPHITRSGKDQIQSMVSGLEMGLQYFAKYKALSSNPSFTKNNQPKK
jgi:hypothetical protein